MIATICALLFVALFYALRSEPRVMVQLESEIQSQRENDCFDGMTLSPSNAIRLFAYGEDPKGRKCTEDQAGSLLYAMLQKKPINVVSVYLSCRFLDEVKREEATLDYLQDETMYLDDSLMIGPDYSGYKFSLDQMILSFFDLTENLASVHQAFMEFSQIKSEDTRGICGIFSILKDRSIQIFKEWAQSIMNSRKEKNALVKTSSWPESLQRCYVLCLNLLFYIKKLKETYPDNASFNSLENIVTTLIHDPISSISKTVTSYITLEKKLVKEFKSMNNNPLPFELTKIRPKIQKLSTLLHEIVHNIFLTLFFMSNITCDQLE